MNAREVTEQMKTLGMRLASEHGADATTIASCHFGLGIVMLRELHIPVEELVAIVQQIAAEHTPN
jgi:hypothetical protein